MPDRGFMPERFPPITVEAEAKATRLILAALESAIDKLPIESAVRDDFVADATRLRTRLAEWEGT